MSFPRDTYPYTNFHELNLGYFIVHFREIFSQWADLYDQMLSWKNATDEELATWKACVEADLDQREAALRAELETWKAQTGQDIAGWEDATLAALTAWQTATQAVFEAIRIEAAGSATAAAASAGDAATAKTAAETAQAAAEAAAASVQDSAAQITTNTEDIADLKTQFDDLVIDKNLLNTCEEYKVGWMGNTDALAEYASGSVWAFIPVTANTGYKCNFDARFIHFMGTNKTQSETNLERFAAGTTFTPQYNGYVHITILNSATNYNNAKMCLASEDFDDVAKYGYCYISDKYIAQTLSDATKAQIEAAVSTPIEQALSFVKSYKVDDSIYNSGVLSNVTTDFTITDEAYIRQDGGEGSASGYQRTDYIDIEDIDGVIVYAYNSGTSGNATYAVYDADHNLLGSSIAAIEDGLFTAFALSLEYPNVKYIRFCSYYGADNSKKLKFQKHAGTATVSQKIQEIEAEENPLKGKKLAVDGDSICYGAGYTGGYAKIIGNRNGMTVQNLAVGGATLASGTGKHIICESMMNLDNDADYIIIEGGVNDSANGVTVGNLTSGYNNTLNTAYFYGAIETVCKQLSIKFAGKKYGFLIPHQMSDTMKPAWKEGLGAFHDAAVKACTKWGVPLLDLSVEVPPFEGFAYSGNSDLVAVADAYTADTTSSGHGDGWHPNENGYKKYYVDKIEAWLKSM